VHPRLGAVDDGTAHGTHDLRQARRVSTFCVTCTRGAVASLIAQPAVERPSDPTLPALGFEDPRSLEERRFVTHMLAVAALEQCDPVAHVVLGEFHDPARRQALPLAKARTNRSTRS
jgi:hypothetical protein